MNANLRAALELVAAGIPIFPALVSWNANAQKLDKKPAINEWQTKATTDPTQIKALWTQFPKALPAIELGRAGLVVLDLDRHPGAPDGVAAFKALRNGQDLPLQPATLTASKGYHLVFRQPSDGEPFGNGRGELPIGCDVRGRGGWIVAPGATSEHGTWGAVKDRPALADAYKSGTIPELPQWLREIIAHKGHKPIVQHQVSQLGSVNAAMRKRR